MTGISIGCTNNMPSKCLVLKRRFCKESRRLIFIIGVKRKNMVNIQYIRKQSQDEEKLKRIPTISQKFRGGGRRENTDI